MTTCKVTCVIQGMLPSHYLHIVNLGNYELSHMCSKVLHLSMLSPWNVTKDHETQCEIVKHDTRLWNMWNSEMQCQNMKHDAKPWDVTSYLSKLFFVHFYNVETFILICLQCSNMPSWKSMHTKFTKIFGTKSHNTSGLNWLLKDHAINFKVIMLRQT
jgi:hypothetical protein